MWYNSNMKKYITLLELQGYFILGVDVDTRILCHKCKRDYEDAGYTVFCVCEQEIYQCCDICGKPGLEYKVKVNGGEENRA